MSETTQNPDGQPGWKARLREIPTRISAGISRIVRPARARMLAPATQGELQRVRAEAAIRAADVASGAASHRDPDQPQVHPNDRFRTNQQPGPGPGPQPGPGPEPGPGPGPQSGPGPEPEQQADSETPEYVGFNPYIILGFDTPEAIRDATDDIIKRAYRKLARGLHPDQNPGNKEAEERFKAISRAYDILTDPQKKKDWEEGILRPYRYMSTPAHPTRGQDRFARDKAGREAHNGGS